MNEVQEVAVALPILWKWLLAACAGIATISAAAAIIHKLFVKPWRDLVERVKKLEDTHKTDQNNNNERFQKDYKMLEQQGEMLKQLCHGVMALLDHAATGNSVDRCRSARDEFRDYIIDNK